jgi:hypothetical protein
METRTPPKVLKFKTFNRVEPVYITHSAMDDFKKCPRRYFFSWVLGYKSSVGNPIFAFGRAYHKFRETLSRKYLSKEYTDPNSPALFFLSHIEAEKLWQKEKPPAPPTNDYKAKKWAFLDSGRLLEACKVAHAFWSKQMQSGVIQDIEIETPFTAHIKDDEHTSGRWDAIIKWSGKLWLKDHKTSTKDKSFFDRGLEPNDQASRYIYAAQQATNQRIEGVVFEVMFHDASKKPTMFASMTSRTETQIKTWLDEQNYWLDALAYARNNDMYPQNETACTFCDFHIVCKGMNENMQTSILKGNLFKHEPYDSMRET